MTLVEHRPALVEVPLLREAVAAAQAVTAQLKIVAEAVQVTLERTQASEKLLARKLEVAMAFATEVVGDDKDAGLMSDADAAKYLGVTMKSLKRWDANPPVGLPPPIWIGKRKYRDRAAMREFKRARAEAA